MYRPYDAYNQQQVPPQQSCPTTITANFQNVITKHVSACRMKPLLPQAGLTTLEKQEPPLFSVDPQAVCQPGTPTAPLTRLPLVELLASSCLSAAAAACLRLRPAGWKNQTAAATAAHTVTVAAIAMPAAAPGDTAG